MRIRANKLILLPIGGALGVGLLVSAFVLPQSKLAASQACYGVCRSDAVLSLSKSTVIDGKESFEEFRVKVTAATSGAAEPTGSVEVKAGSRLLCHFGLSHGEGHCSLTNKELGAGSYEIEAHYSGSLDPSTSGKKHLEVVKGDSAADLTLSQSQVTYGKESDEEFRVKVSTPDSGAGKPTGSVDVKEGPKLLCHFGLSHGEGHCFLGDKKLGHGSYRIEAHYSGDTELNQSTSGKKHLTVHRES